MTQTAKKIGRPRKINNKRTTFTLGEEELEIVRKEAQRLQDICKFEPTLTQALKALIVRGASA